MLCGLAFKAMNAVHRSVLRISGGRAGWNAQSMPVLEFTTTGRKTGRARSVLLTSPLQDGATLVVVASRGGDDKPPAWFLNLQANPAVSVALQGKPAQPMQGRIASTAERTRLGPLVIADHQNYADYQTKTTREIALVLLGPAA
jgi:deazaflavin-dependent oxidoreductase (nitroreductase family)